MTPDDDLALRAELAAGWPRWGLEARARRQVAIDELVDAVVSVDRDPRPRSVRMGRRPTPNPPAPYSGPFGKELADVRLARREQPS